MNDKVPVPVADRPGATVGPRCPECRQEGNPCAHWDVNRGCQLRTSEFSDFLQEFAVEFAGRVGK